MTEPFTQADVTRLLTELVCSRDKERDFYYKRLFLTVKGTEFCVAAR